MGMFDYIKCHYPLSVEGANALVYQTKDTDRQFMDQYEIREDGTLWCEEYDIEDQSDPNAVTPLGRLVGMMTKVNKRWVQDKMSGQIRFYTQWKDKQWIEFVSFFKDGQLQQIFLDPGMK